MRLSAAFFNVIVAAQTVARREQAVIRSQDSVIVDEVLLRVLSTAQSILGQPVQPSDNFFDLGGDSMLAVEMMNTLEDHFGVELDPVSIIDAEDMTELAMSLHNQLWEP
jgi:acyl carrier protein